MFIYKDNESLKKEIKKSITDNDTTAKAVATQLGMSPQTYQSLLNKKNFSFVDMQKICDAIGCDLVIDIVKRNK